MITKKIVPSALLFVMVACAAKAEPIKPAHRCDDTIHGRHCYYMPVKVVDESGAECYHDRLYIVCSDGRFIKK
jgi:hypothetical protein